MESCPYPHMFKVNLYLKVQRAGAGSLAVLCYILTQVRIALELTMGQGDISLCPRVQSVGCMQSSVLGPCGFLGSAPVIQQMQI